MIHNGRARRATAAVACIAVICLTAVSGSAGGAVPASKLRGFARTQAIIETSRLHCLMLELYLADSTAQQAQGLMFIERMDEFEGMLFRYPRDAKISMWMKNTYISLDMLFIRADGEIAHIARRTTPMSTASISSVHSVRFVLEINAGMAERQAIEPGNRLLAID